MKRFPKGTPPPLAVVLLSLMLYSVPGCTVAPDGNTNAANGNAAANANLNANANLSATGGAAHAAEVTAREKQLWDALKNKDLEAFGKMLASELVYVSGDGAHDKAATLNGLKGFVPTEVTFSDWKTVTLDDDAVVVTYTIDAKGTTGGQPLPPGLLRASTAWVKRGAEWMAVYHQDSPVEAAPANPPAAETSKPASSPAAASNANAAATPAAAAANDPVAKEKQVWDALKRGDWTAFAAHLAEDQLEVGTHGVSDKAGTLASVKGNDFSGVTTGDFKATELDKDVTLVTYTVKGPKGPDGKPFEEVSSTIWVNRGGKWLAVFHHATPAMKMPSK
jgi:hypothetical protein